MLGAASIQVERRHGKGVGRLRSASRRSRRRRGGECRTRRGDIRSRHAKGGGRGGRGGRGGVQQQQQLEQQHAAHTRVGWARPGRQSRATQAGGAKYAAAAVARLAALAAHDAVAGFFAKRSPPNADAFPRRRVGPSAAVARIARSRACDGQSPGEQRQSGIKTKTPPEHRMA